MTVKKFVIPQESLPVYAQGRNTLDRVTTFVVGHGASLAQMNGGRETLRKLRVTG
jgi:hypothetical protein